MKYSYSTGCRYAYCSWKLEGDVCLELLMGVTANYVCTGAYLHGCWESTTAFFSVGDRVCLVSLMYNNIPFVGLFYNITSIPLYHKLYSFTVYCWFPSNVRITQIETPLPILFHEVIIIYYLLSNIVGSSCIHRSHYCEHPMYDIILNRDPHCTSSPRLLEMHAQVLNFWLLK